jgi:hypothetical protein
VRHCFFEDISNSGMIALVNGFGEATNWSIYGNVFCHSGDLVEEDNQISPAVILTKYEKGVTEIVPKNWRILNNTFANIAGNTGFRFAYVASPGDVVARNNLFWRGIGGAIHQTESIDIDYNWYGDNQTQKGRDLDQAAAAAEHHSQAGEEDPFVDYHGKNWTIKRPLMRGQEFPAPYDVDAFGNKRGQDGLWDVGAYEFSQSPAASIPMQTQTATPALIPAATPAQTQINVNGKR